MKEPSAADRDIYTEGSELVFIDFIEMHFIEVAATLRHNQNLLRMSSSEPGDHESAIEGQEKDIVGAYGEYVFGKLTNQFISFVVADMKSVKADAGTFQEVKSTPYRFGHLMVQKTDKDEKAYILVRHWEYDKTGAWWRVGGWLYGMEAKQEKWYTHIGMRSAAYKVHASELRPIKTLPFDLWRPYEE